MKSFTSLIIAAYFIQDAASVGKEVEPLPRLSKGTLKALAPKAPLLLQEATQSVATCYQGYTLMSDGTCVKSISEPPTPAEGDITVPYITRCPAGFIAENGQCIQTSDVPMAYFCPIGFDDDGTSCSQVMPGEVATSCNEGELINNLCVWKQKAPHLVTPKCPEGSQVAPDGNCWKTLETFDCTAGAPVVPGRVIAAPKIPIPLGKKILVSKGKEGGRLRSLHPVKETPVREDVRVPTGRLPYGPPSKHSVPGKLAHGKEHITATTTILPPVPTVCPHKELISVTPPHPTKIAPVSQLCAKQVAVDSIAIVSCPPGFEDFGEFCGKETTSPPVVLCLSNGLTEGACPPSVRRVPKVVRCPNGAPPVGDRCMSMEAVPAENVCAQGFRDTGNGCTARVKSGGLECRPGLTLVQGMCVGKSIRPSVAMDLKAPPGCANKY